MNAWFALTKKEFRLGLPAFIIVLVLYSGFILFGYASGYRFGYESAMTLACLLVVLALHSLFLLFYLSYTLNVERKRLHLWLHTPMPIAGLLLSKLASGFVFMLITFIPTSIASIVLFNQHAIDWLSNETFFNIAALITIGIFSSALFLAAIFILFWSIFLILSKRMNDFLSFVLTFILFLFISWGYQELMNTSIMETLWGFGQIQIQDIVVGMEFPFMQSEREGELILERHIYYIGHWIRDLIVSVLAFLTACWAIDRKVEV